MLGNSDTGLDREKKWSDNWIGRIKNRKYRDKNTERQKVKEINRNGGRHRTK
jgi:hypothetical protein